MAAIESIPVPFYFQDLTGHRFDMLSVLGYAGQKPNATYSLWICHCDCGKEKVLADDYLVSRRTHNIKKCCGCLYPSEYLKPKNHPLYSIYYTMIYRCYNEGARIYRNYGARGISVCQEWRDNFEIFLRDVGERPGPNYSIDRIDNDGNYEPSNVRWSTFKEQSNNRRSSKLFHGITHVQIPNTPRLTITNFFCYTQTKKWSEQASMLLPYRNESDHCVYYEWRSAQYVTSSFAQR